MIDTKIQDYTISRWHAEFLDPAAEAAYHRHVEADVALFLGRALKIWAFLLLIFAWPDWLALGYSDGFFILLSLRIAHVCLLLWLALMLSYKPHWATLGWPVTLVSIAGYPLFFVYPYILPDDGAFGLAIMMMMMLSLYIFVPNRLKLMNLIAAVGVGMVMLNVIIAGGSVVETVLVVMVLAWPIAIGFAAAQRINTGNRKAFAALVRAESINKALTQEIDYRKTLETELQRQALTDPLTGLSNRRQYELLFRRELERHRRHGTPIALGMIDLDHFKHINDEHGHEFGDQILNAVAEALQEPLRSGDILGRFGGEEFILILPDTRLEQAVQVAERMRESLRSIGIIKNGQTIHITATFAMTEVRAEDSEISDIIRRADETLYKGKRAGRDRVMAAESAA
ncbi:MAG: GGDEF domain-containing protein [Pseudohongiella sp.]|uniref:GGDEF domain-containing protein n=1 Tax=Pseudohongiella sp. TaxID=1979412 RepID=UPI0034A06ECD